MTTTNKASLIVADGMKFLIAFLLKRSPTFSHNTHKVRIPRNLNHWLKMELSTLN